MRTKYNREKKLTESRKTYPACRAHKTKQKKCKNVAPGTYQCGLYIMKYPCYVFGDEG